MCLHLLAIYCNLLILHITFYRSNLVVIDFSFGWFRYDNTSISLEWLYILLLISHSFYIFLCFRANFPFDHIGIIVFQVFIGHRIAFGPDAYHCADCINCNILTLVGPRSIGVGVRLLYESKTIYSSRKITMKHRTFAEFVSAFDHFGFF